MSNTIPISDEASNPNGKEKVNKNDFKAYKNMIELKRDSHRENISLSTTISMSSIDLNNTQTKDILKDKTEYLSTSNSNTAKKIRNPKKLRVRFANQIDVIDVDCYKEYNKMTQNSIFFEAMSDISATCGRAGCTII